MVKETHLVPQQKQPIRLQDYGVGIFNTASTKSALKKAIKKQLVFIDGIQALTGTYLKGNELITLHEEKQQHSKKKFILKLEVVYEDNFLAIVEKPPGILVSGNSFKTVANALEQNLKQSPEKDAVKAQPVHRLDFPTTGLLLIGKTSTSILALNQLFENKQVRKTYSAITIGEMPVKGKIDIPIGGKEALTRYQVNQTIPSKRFGILNLLTLYPETGRKHQLRQHLSTIGNPILGDASYCSPEMLLKGKGLYLHAKALRFVHPFTQEEMKFTSTLPKKFNTLFLKNTAKH